MKLMEVIDLNEQKIIAALKNGESTAIYKNPTPEELQKISLNGVVKGVLTHNNFIGYDFQNVERRDLPQLNGFFCILYLTTGNKVTIQPLPGFRIDQKHFEDVVNNNDYLSQFNVTIYHQDQE